MFNALVPLSHAARRRIQLVAAGLVAAIASFAPAAEWLHSMSYVYGPQFNSIEVTFAGLDQEPGAVTPSIEDCWLFTGVTTTANGYTLDGSPDFPEINGPGCDLLVAFTADSATFCCATLWSGDTELGVVDSEGILRNGQGEVIGEFVVWLAPKPDAAKQKILNQLANWGAKLNNPPPVDPAGPHVAHANQMKALYAVDATLLPTVGTYNLYRQAVVPTIFSYFDGKFLPLKPKMLPINPANVHVVYAGGGGFMASANGLYTFTTMVGPCGTPLPKAAVTKARFTFVFTKESSDGAWTIVQHHSSKDPTAPASCPGDLNADCKVDGLDIGILLAAWGACP